MHVNGIALDFPQGCGPQPAAPSGQNDGDDVMPEQSFCATAIFDGVQMHHAATLEIAKGRVTAIGQNGGINLGEGVIVPGLLDLQVNGCGGVQLGADTDAEALASICRTQIGLGTTGCLPTLITDTAEVTRRVIDAGIAAGRAGVAGFLGLHLEGPHLDPRRKGAHDAALIRPMSDADLALLLGAVRDLPALMVTLAPESVRMDQIAALAQAGVIVSLGHTDCTAEVAQQAMQAGARCATHLFNAMSPLTSRAAGMVGAVLAGDGFAGLIADGIHVDAVTLRVALAAKKTGVFLVSDCMALTGTAAQSFDLGGRRILRGAGRLTLQDGTLAGADLTLVQAVDRVTDLAGIAPERALAMATAIPAQVLGRRDIGFLTAGARADFIHLLPDGSLGGVWVGGVQVG